MAGTPPRGDKSGFTLAEITISVVIIAMMMMSLLEIVAYAGEVWQRSHLTNTLTGEGQMVLDSIEREMGFASDVLEPDVGDPATSTIQYKKNVFDYNHSTSFSTATFIIEKPLTERRIYSQYTEATLDGLTDGTSWTIVTDPSATPPNKEFARSRYNYDLSRHIDVFEVTRTSAHLLDCKVILRAVRANDGFDKEFVFTRSIVIPNPGL